MLTLRFASSTILSVIVAAPVAFAAPVKEPVVIVTSPVADIVLPVASAVEVSALPVTAPVIGPANPVAVNTPVFELNAKLLPDFGAKSPVAAVTNNGKQVASLDSSATVMSVGVVDPPPPYPYQ